MKSTETLRTYHAGDSAVAFPLGGIGTGNVSLGARGNLLDWEIFNRAAKGTHLPNTFFAIHTRAQNQAPITKVLEGPIPPPYTPSHGFHPTTNAGLPRLDAAVLRGEYPVAYIDFEDADLPVRVGLEAFTPLVPLDPEDSGIPGAVFTWTLTNPGAEPVDVTLVGSLYNPVGGLGFDRFGNLNTSADSGTINRFQDENGLRGLFLSAEGLEPTDRRYGDLSLATDHPNVTVKPSWLRSGWWDFLQEFWDDLNEDGRLNDLGYTTRSEPRRADTGSLGLVDTLAPGESRSYRFFLTWYFPNRAYGWETKVEQTQRNRYAARFDSSWAAARYLTDNLPHLEAETRRFHDALFQSTLPASVLDALSANIVPVRSTTCFWLEDGRFFGWEGCFDDGGCCEGSCTHVWSYAQTSAFLFPSLERSMRRTEFVAETESDGYMFFRTANSFRLEPAKPDAQRGQAAVDGQMGSILRAYREWLLSGDRDWLAEVWPGIKRSIVFASTQWDTDQDGVLDGRQHNTYDIEFYGPNPLCMFYYLAALRAVEEMATAMGEAEPARRCREAFTRGSERTDALLWNGEYYVQRVEDVNAHRYQHGEGCLSDHLLGQLHARLLGLGDLAPKEHLQAAIHAVFKHNYLRDFRRHANCQRTYVFPGEAGLLLCTWPNGGRPTFPFPYSDEVWTGIEYQVAAHLIYEGWPEEGLEIVRAARERHDGVRRNPWNEVECGHHYARSMASWALLTALSGVHTDLGQGVMRFAPVVEASTDPNLFRTFWSNGRGWGVYTQRRDPQTGDWTPELEVLGGDLSGVKVEACGKEWTL